MTKQQLSASMLIVAILGTLDLISTPEATSGQAFARLTAVAFLATVSAWSFLTRYR
jgi:hypothetical protein